MTNKKSTLLRIGLFLLIAFGIPFGVQGWYFTQYGWSSSGQGFPVLVSFCMLCPALANVLTRLITRQGGEHLLIDFRVRGTRLSYPVAIFLPVLCALAVFLMTALCCLPEGSVGKIFEEIPYGKTGAYLLYVLANALCGILFGFGEEFGWRGYLTPELEKLLPLPAVLAITGVLWGLWHGLLIAGGAYYTREEGESVWLALLLMCLYGIGLSVLCTALTKSTGSVIAASLSRIGLHRLVVPVSTMLLSYASEEQLAQRKLASCDTVTLTVTALICLITGLLFFLVRRRPCVKTKPSG